MPSNYADMKDEISKALIGDHAPKAEGALEVELVVVHKRPLRTKSVGPRGDLDNFAKGVLDAANGIIWDDDRQIVSLLLKKQWGDSDYISLSYREIETTVVGSAG